MHPKMMKRQQWPLFFQEDPPPGRQKTENHPVPEDPKKRIHHGRGTLENPFLKAWFHWQGHWESKRLVQLRPPRDPGA